MVNPTQNQNTNPKTLSINDDDPNSPNHPLFLHQHDYPSLVLILKKLTRSDNYGSWKRSMMIAFDAKNKLKLVTGEFEQPTANSIHRALWEITNDMIISWILNTIDEQIIYQLTNDLVQLKQNNLAIEIYYHNLKGLWDEYDCLEAPYMCVCACACENGRVDRERDQRKRLIQFLMGLDECYANVRGQIILMNPMPSVAKAYSMIRQEHKQREAFSFKNTPTALSTYSNNPRNSYNNNLRFGNNNSRFEGTIVKGNHLQGVTVKVNQYQGGILLEKDNHGVRTINMAVAQGSPSDVSTVGSSNDAAMSARIDQLQNQLNQMVLMMQNNKETFGVPFMRNIETTNTSQSIPTPPSPPPVRKYTRSTKLPTKFNDFHVHLHKTKHTLNSTIKFHHFKYINYHNITSSQHKHLINNINITVEPQFYSQASKDPRWVDVMTKELQALASNNTWTLISLPPNKFPIACKWVYKIKFKLDGLIERFKARLVAKGFTQQKGIDYTETFALIAKMVTDKDFLALVIYVDDILLTGNNLNLINHIKKQLDEAFIIKDLGNLNYYLGIEFLRSAKGITMTQRKYVIELLSSAEVLDLKPSHIPVDPIKKLNDTDGDLITDPSQSRALVGKLLYLTITRPNLSYAAHLSQFSHSPRTPHLKALIKENLEFLRKFWKYSYASDAQHVDAWGKPDFKVIKKRIEDLITREYLERDKENPQ
ncbi:cysteine-rich receptor-like protein kinase 8 [Tanacetum coccineum]|uniref:Cysteine-rich receptor-like protein kinase 8 n=1 Tax=Tanacetum coccineum TaxID=301880 RepID=A0ABQ5ASZ9_9ASTR